MELLECVSKAEEISKGVSDPELKLITYEIVLSHLLSSYDSVRSTNPNTLTDGSSSFSEQTTSEPVKKITDWLDINPSDVTEFLNFEEDGVKISMPLSKVPSKIADGQRFIALIKLAVDKIGYGTDSQQAKIIISICKNYNCFDPNFASNIKDRDDWIETVGSKGSMKTYKIRRAGIDEAARELKKVIDVKSNQMAAN